MIRMDEEQENIDVESVCSWHCIAEPSSQILRTLPASANLPCVPPQGTAILKHSTRAYFHTDPALK